MEIVTVGRTLDAPSGNSGPSNGECFSPCPYGCKMRWVKKYFILMECTGRHCSTGWTTGWLGKCGSIYLTMVRLPLNHGASFSRLCA